MSTREEFKIQEMQKWLFINTGNLHGLWKRRQYSKIFDEANRLARSGFMQGFECSDAHPEKKPSWLTIHACLTGDCPHDHANDCLADLKKSIESSYSDDLPNQSLLAENARLKSFALLVKKWAFATDGRKFDGNHKEVLKLLVDQADEALSQSPAEEHVPLKDVMPLVEAAEDVSCECTVQERLRGHRVACGMPALQEALAAFEKARGK